MGVPLTGKNLTSWGGGGIGSYILPVIKKEQFQASLAVHNHQCTLKIFFTNILGGGGNIFSGLYSMHENSLVSEALGGNLYICSNMI